jgi:hypothetical protein
MECPVGAADLEGNAWTSFEQMLHAKEVIPPGAVSRKFLVMEMIV